MNVSPSPNCRSLSAEFKGILTPMSHLSLSVMDLETPITANAGLLESAFSEESDIPTSNIKLVLSSISVTTAKEVLRTMARLDSASDINLNLLSVTPMFSSRVFFPIHKRQLT